MKTFQRRKEGAINYGGRTPPKRKNVPSHYKDQWNRLHRSGVVEVLMNPTENVKQHSKDYKAIVEDWPVSRIKALSEMKSMSHKGLARTLGLTKRTLTLLIEGKYTPSATLCRRMEMIETDLKDGKDLGLDITPNRSEMRRRMTLFRSWWLNQPPSFQLPEVTVSIKVRWGKGVINAFEIPANMTPKMRINSFDGLVLTVREVTKTLRKVTRSYRKMLWTDMEEDYWQRYAQNTIPAIVEKRLKTPSLGGQERARRRKDASNA